jgi:hypothetical protein
MLRSFSLPFQAFSTFSSHGNKPKTAQFKVAVHVMSENQYIWDHSAKGWGRGEELVKRRDHEAIFS